MTVSIITLGSFNNDDNLAAFEHELQNMTRSQHRFGDHVIFAEHDGTTRTLFDALNAAAGSSLSELVIIEAKEVQDSSWKVRGSTFDWLNRALPNHESQRTAEV